MFIRYDRDQFEFSGCRTLNRLVYDVIIMSLRLVVCNHVTQ